MQNFITTIVFLSIILFVIAVLNFPYIMIVLIMLGLGWAFGCLLWILSRDIAKWILKKIDQWKN